jgi:hypothetical protein
VKNGLDRGGRIRMARGRASRVTFGENACAISTCVSCESMNTPQPKFPRSLWRDPTLVPRRLIPFAYGVFLVGFAVSAALLCAGRSPTLEDGIMSDLLSREDNPRGYLIAATATMLSGFLLLPVATLFQRSRRGPHRGWAVLGAWLYRLGLVAVIATGISTPFQQPYVPVHLWLSYLAFMGMAAGLGVGLCVAACPSGRGRLRLAALAALHVGALLFLAYLFFTPTFFEGRRWFLAVCEWMLSVLIAVGTLTLTAVSAGAPDRIANPEC